MLISMCYKDKRENMNRGFRRFASLVPVSSVLYLSYFPLNLKQTEDLWSFPPVAVTLTHSRQSFYVIINDLLCLKVFRSYCNLLDWLLRNSSHVNRPVDKLADRRPINDSLLYYVYPVSGCDALDWFTRKVSQPSIHSFGVNRRKVFQKSKFLVRNRIITME